MWVLIFRPSFIQNHFVYFCLIWLISIRSKTSHSPTVALTDKATKDASWWSSKTVVVVSGTAAVSKSSSPSRPMEKQRESQNGQDMTFKNFRDPTQSNSSPLWPSESVPKAWPQMPNQKHDTVHLGDLMRSSETYGDILSGVCVIQAFQGLEESAGLKDISILVKTIQDLPQVVLESKYWGWVRQTTNTSQTKGLPITYWPKNVPPNGLKFDENSLRTAPPSSCWPPALAFALPMDKLHGEKFAFDSTS